MSNFEIWPERDLYEGHAGVKDFLRSWLEPWDSYEHHLEALLDAGDEVVAILHVSGTASGAGHIVRTTMYSEPAQALEAVGLRE
jgi:ketosteroid isomerase-like protein